MQYREESTTSCLGPILIYIPRQSCFNCLHPSIALMAIRAVSSGAGEIRTLNLVFAKHLHSHCATAPFVQSDNLISMQTVSSRELPVTSPGVYLPYRH